MASSIKWRISKTAVVLVGLVVAGASIGGIFWLSNRQTPEQEAQVYYKRGVKLAEQREYAKAVIELRNALRLNKSYLPAWRSLAQIEENTQRWGDMVRSLQSILSLAPDDIDVRIKLAKLLALGGRVYQALELTDTGQDADNQNAKLLGLKAAILYKLDNRADAIREAQRALLIDPANPDALVVLASDKFAKGDLKGALEFLDRDTTSSVSDLGIQMLKLKIFEQSADLQKFESLLLSITKSHPDEIIFQKQLVKFYIDQHRESDAENEMRVIAKANPANTEIELDLVRFLLATKGSSAARQELAAKIESGGEVFPYQIALADFDISQGKFDDAEQRVKNLLTNNISNQNRTDAQIKLAEIDFRKGEFEGTEAIVSDILRRDARNAAALKVRAAVRIARGQFNLAIGDLELAIEDKPRSMELMLLLALAYERSGSIGRAEKQYAEAVRNSNFDPSVGLQYVNFLLRRGGIERAEQFLTELSKRSPKNVGVLSALAQVELARRDWASAQSTAGLIRGVGDGSGLADQILGAALIGQQKYEESISVFENAVNASPTAVQPMVSLVQALVRAKKIDKAKEFLGSALQAKPDNIEAQILLGSVDLAAGARDEAIERFKLAIEKGPRNPAGYQALASLYSGEAKYDEALNVIRSGLEKLPDSVVLQLANADALEQTRQYDAAIAQYERILVKEPGSMIAANNLASLLSDRRDDKASLDRAQVLVVSLRDSKIPQFKDTLGWVSYRRDDFVNAVPLLEKAAAGLPTLPLVRYHLAMSYIAIRQSAKAVEQLNSALSLNPDPELRAKITATLKKLEVE